jgi:hypothetical protein
VDIAPILDLQEPEMTQPKTEIIDGDKRTESFASAFGHKNYASKLTGPVASSQLIVSSVIFNNESVPPPPPPKLEDGAFESGVHTATGSCQLSSSEAESVGESMSNKTFNHICVCMKNVSTC